MKILHAKMTPEALNYKNELLTLSRDLHSIDAQYIPAVEQIINHFIEEKKYTAAEVMLENYPDYHLFSQNGLLDICRLYVAVNNISLAPEVYQFTITSYPDTQDHELDSLFRVPTEFNDESSSSFTSLIRPKENFNDVGGMDNVKREIDLKIIQPLKNVELFKKFGKKIGGGILLYGPPGCGKTFMARATAGEINAHFFSIGLSDILSMWIGQSENNLHEFFETARQYKPSVVFIDEIDALGMKRSQFHSSGGRNVVNQLLTELDGIESKNDGLLVIGATNTPWDIDSALRRPGRFDRIIFVPPPDQKSRETILRLKLNDKPISDIDYTAIAKKTEGYSGADIDAIIDEAIEGILEKTLRTGISSNITTNDILRAVKNRRPSTLEWFNTVKNYTAFANKSGIYDDVVQYMKSHKL